MVGNRNYAALSIADLQGLQGASGCLANRQIAPARLCPGSGRIRRLDEVAGEPLSPQRGVSGHPPVGLARHAASLAGYPEGRHALPPAAVNNRFQPVAVESLCANGTFCYRSAAPAPLSVTIPLSRGAHRTVAAGPPRRTALGVRSALG